MKPPDRCDLSCFAAVIVVANSNLLAMALRITNTPTIPHQNRPNISHYNTNRQRVGHFLFSKHERRPNLSHVPPPNRLASVQISHPRTDFGSDHAKVHVLSPVTRKKALVTIIQRPGVLARTAQAEGRNALQRRLEHDRWSAEAPLIHSRKHMWQPKRTPRRELCQQG